MYIDNKGRGKEYTTTAKQWTVLVHSMAYEEPDLVAKTEAVLKSLRKKDDKNLIANTEMYLRLGYRLLEAVYHGARVTALMAE